MFNSRKAPCSERKTEKKGREYDQRVGGAFVREPGKCLAEGRGKDQGRS